ncbi:primase alpha helix C-terminal domain-containing protein [Enterococcus sp. LJL98]
MIYISTVQTNRSMQGVELERDFLFFRDYKPQHFNYPKDEQEEQRIKLHEMLIAISGKLIDGKRSNKNLIERNLLFLDFDSIENESEFLKKVSDGFKNVNYCLYPTLKHTPFKPRYRLVVELDTPVKELDYKALVWGFQTDLGIQEIDLSNLTWSQGQGLPVNTNENKQAKRHYQDDRKPLDVSKALRLIKQREGWKKPHKSKYKHIPSARTNLRRGNRIGALLNQIAEGAEDGNRNTWLTSICGSMVANGTELENAYALLQVINENFISNPIEMGELNKIFSSVLSMEARKRGLNNE